MSRKIVDEQVPFIVDEEFGRKLEIDLTSNSNSEVQKALIIFGYIKSRGIDGDRVIEKLQEYTKFKAENEELKSNNNILFKSNQYLKSEFVKQEQELDQLKQRIKNILDNIGDSHQLYPVLMQLLKERETK